MGAICAAEIISHYGARSEADLKALVDTDLTDLETRLEAAGAPWTPGRLPVLRPVD